MQSYDEITKKYQSYLNEGQKNRLRQKASEISMQNAATRQQVQAGAMKKRSRMNEQLSSYGLASNLTRAPSSGVDWQARKMPEYHQDLQTLRAREQGQLDPYGRQLMNETIAAREAEARKKSSRLRMVKVKDPMTGDWLRNENGKIKWYDEKTGSRLASNLIETAKDYADQLSMAAYNTANGLISRETSSAYAKSAERVNTSAATTVTAQNIKKSDYGKTGTALASELLTRSMQAQQSIYDDEAERKAAGEKVNVPPSYLDAATAALWNEMTAAEAKDIAASVNRDVIREYQDGALPAAKEQETAATEKAEGVPLNDMAPYDFRAGLNQTEDVTAWLRERQQQAAEKTKTLGGESGQKTEETDALTGATWRPNTIEMAADGVKKLAAALGVEKRKADEEEAVRNAAVTWKPSGETLTRDQIIEKREAAEADGIAPDYAKQNDKINAGTTPNVSPEVVTGEKSARTVSKAELLTPNWYRSEQGRAALNGVSLPKTMTTNGTVTETAAQLIGAALIDREYESGQKREMQRLLRSGDVAGAYLALLTARNDNAARQASSAAVANAKTALINYAKTNKDDIIAWSALEGETISGAVRAAYDKNDWMAAAQIAQAKAEIGSIGLSNECLVAVNGLIAGGRYAEAEKLAADFRETDGLNTYKADVAAAFIGAGRDLTGSAYNEIIAMCEDGDWKSAEQRVNEVVAEGRMVTSLKELVREGMDPRRASAVMTMWRSGDTDGANALITKFVTEENDRRNAYAAETYLQAGAETLRQAVAAGYIMAADAEEISRMMANAETAADAFAAVTYLNEELTRGEIRAIVNGPVPENMTDRREALLNRLRVMGMYDERIDEIMAAYDADDMQAVMSGYAKGFNEQKEYHLSLDEEEFWNQYDAAEADWSIEHRDGVSDRDELTVKQIEYRREYFHQLASMRAADTVAKYEELGEEELRTQSERLYGEMSALDDEIETEAALIAANEQTYGGSELRAGMAEEKNFEHRQRMNELELEKTKIRREWSLMGAALKNVATGKRTDALNALVNEPKQNEDYGFLTQLGADIGIDEANEIYDKGSDTALYYYVINGSLTGDERRMLNGVAEENGTTVDEVCANKAEYQRLARDVQAKIDSLNEAMRDSGGTSPEAFEEKLSLMRYKSLAETQEEKDAIQRRIDQLERTLTPAEERRIQAEIKSLTNDKAELDRLVSVIEKNEALSNWTLQFGQSKERTLRELELDPVAAETRFAETDQQMAVEDIKESVSVMTDEERKTFRYWVGYDEVNGTQRAALYLRDLQTHLNERRMAQIEEWAYGAGSTGWLGSLTANIASTLACPVEMQGGIYTVFKAIAGKDVDPYSMIFSAQVAHEAIQQGTADAISKAVESGSGSADLASVAAFAYQSVMSCAQSMYLCAFGSTLAGAVGATGTLADVVANAATLPVFGLTSAAQAEREALMNGATQEQAYAMAFTSGVYEMLFEVVSVEKFIHMDKGALWPYIKSVLVSAGVEASEELCTEIANTVTNVAVLGNLGDMAQQEAMYLQAGLNPGTARSMAFTDQMKQIGLAGAGGFLSGGLGAAIQNVQIRQNLAAQGRMLKATGEVNSIMTEASKSSDSMVKSIYAKLNQAYANNRNLSNLKVGQLNYALSQASFTEISASIDNLRATGEITKKEADMLKELFEKQCFSVLPDGSDGATEAEVNAVNQQALEKLTMTWTENENVQKTSATNAEISERVNAKTEAERAEQRYQPTRTRLGIREEDMAEDVAERTENAEGTAGLHQNRTRTAAQETLTEERQRRLNLIEDLYGQDSPQARKARALIEAARTAESGTDVQAMTEAETARTESVAVKTVQTLYDQARANAERMKSAGTAIDEKGVEKQTEKLAVNAADENQTVKAEEAKTKIRAAAEAVRNALTSLETKFVETVDTETEPAPTAEQTVTKQEAVAAEPSMMVRYPELREAYDADVAAVENINRALETNGADSIEYANARAARVETLAAYNDELKNVTGILNANGHPIFQLSAKSLEHGVKATETTDSGLTVKLHQLQSLTEMTNEQLEKLRVLEAFNGAGFNIVAHDTLYGIGANGAYMKNGNELHIALDGMGGVMTTLSHELTHFIEENATKEEFEAFKAFMVRQADRRGGPIVRGWEALVNEKLNEYEDTALTDAENRVVAESEALASMCEDMLKDRMAVAELIQQDFTLGEKILRMFDRILEKFEELAGKTRSTEATRMVDELEEARTMWFELLQDAKRNANAGTETVVQTLTDTESLNERWSKRALPEREARPALESARTAFRTADRDQNMMNEIAEAVRAEHKGENAEDISRAQREALAKFRESQIPAAAKELAMLLNSGKGHAFKDVIRNLDTFGRRNKDARQLLYEAVERPFNEAADVYTKSLNGATERIRKLFMENGINVEAKTKAEQQEAKAMSAAVQKIGENMNKHGENVPYTLEDLEQEFPENWEGILKTAEGCRKIYDTYIDDLNQMLEGIYPNVIEHAETDLVKFQAYEDAARTKEKEQREFCAHLYSKRAELNYRIEKLKSADTYDAEGMRKAKSQMATVEARIKIAERDLAYRTGKLAERAAQRQAMEDAIANGDILKNRRVQRRQDYFHHFSEADNSILTMIQEMRMGMHEEIDPQLAGRSAMTKPKSRWAGFMQRRNGPRTVLDAYGGMIRYANAAEYKLAFDPLCEHLRTLEQSVRDAGSLSPNTTYVQDFVTWLRSWRNQLLGKSNDFDRRVQEQYLSRDTLKLVKKFNSIAKGNSVMGNFRSAIVQVSNITNAATYVANPKDWINGVLNFARMKFGGNASLQEIRDSSAFLRQRYGLENESWKSTFKAKEAALWMMGVGDETAGNLMWWAAYSRYERLGKTAIETEMKHEYESAAEYADDITRRSTAGRGVGELPELLTSRIVNMAAPFQVEALNTYQNIKEQVGKKNVAGLIAFEAVTWFLNGVFEALFKDRPLPFDFIDAIADIIENARPDGDDDDEERNVAETLLGSGQRLLGEAVAGLPFVTQAVAALAGEERSQEWFGDSDPTKYGTGFMGAGALLDALSSGGKLVADIAAGKMKDAETGRLSAEKLWTHIINDAEFAQMAVTLGIGQLTGDTPWGGAQLTRTAKGLDTMVRGYSQKLDSNGELRAQFAVDRSDPVAWLKALAFGKWATNEGQSYLEGDTKMLSAKDTKVLKEAEKLGQDPTEFFELLAGIKACEAVKDDDGKTVTSKRAEQMKLIAEMDMTTKQKLNMLKTVDMDVYYDAQNAFNKGIAVNVWLKYSALKNDASGDEEKTKAKDRVCDALYADDSIYQTDKMLIEQLLFAQAGKEKEYVPRDYTEQALYDLSGWSSNAESNEKARNMGAEARTSGISTDVFRDIFMYSKEDGVKKADVLQRIMDTKGLTAEQKTRTQEILYPQDEGKTKDFSNQAAFEAKQSASKKRAAEEAAAAGIPAEKFAIIETYASTAKRDGTLPTTEEIQRRIQTVPGLTAEQRSESEKLVLGRKTARDYTSNETFELSGYGEGQVAKAKVAEAHGISMATYLTETRAYYGFIESGTGENAGGKPSKKQMIAYMTQEMGLDRKTAETLYKIANGTIRK